MLALEGNGDVETHVDQDSKGDSSNPGLVFLPQGGYSALGGSQIPLLMMNQLLSSNLASLQVGFTYLLYFFAKIFVSMYIR